MSPWRIKLKPAGGVMKRVVPRAILWPKCAISTVWRLTQWLNE
ncbi:hypothetical protein SLEP1_g52429 [Rubroshorea leprosula]|uniref:Uncharacterized protein n=1 Tax=Rubroshorea leprosula TaxID=152421 RepID=A0AAV5M8I3_9ROSI|nr:hypothetical protein SLEP1_g52429 [Rubroshorea leprosula]